MSITNTWIIEQMNCYPSSKGKTDVVFNVAWRVNATDGTYDATAYGTQGVTYVAGEPYTPYDQLTQTQVAGWVQDAMGQDRVNEILSGLAANIANQANPPVVSPPLPWV